jgi:DNA-binding MarR family transcriptional regulator
MTRIVQGLEADGLIRRTRDPNDGRVHRLQATAKGRRVMQQGRERRVGNLASLLDRLPAHEIQRVHEAAMLVEKALAEQA